MPKVRTQADRRKHAMFTDQHGRKWFAVIEKDTMHPCSAITPHGWVEAPGCRVPDHYKTFLHEEDPFRMTINYDQWITDLEAAREDYDNRCATTAAFMSPDDGGTRFFRINEETGERFYAPTLVRYVGGLPAPVELARAMRAGNKWALGLVNPDTGKPFPRPKWAEKFAPAPERTVVDDENEFPDADEEREGAQARDEDDEEDFEPALTAEQLRELDRERVQFPDEPEDRLEDEDDGTEIPGLDDDEEEGDVFTELASAPQGAGKPEKPKDPKEAKPTRRGATTKNKG